MSIALKSHDFRMGVDDNRLALLDAPNQIARHALRQSLGSDDHVNASGCGSEKDGSLSRRVAGADYDQVLALTHLRFDECRTVVHTRTLKPRWLIN